jgi:hypothetical protein
VHTTETGAIPNPSTVPPGVPWRMVIKLPAPPVALNKYVLPATALVMVLYSPAKAQVVMVTGVFVVGATAVPKAAGFVHWACSEGVNNGMQKNKMKIRCNRDFLCVHE